MAVSRELGDNPAVEDDASADMPADVDTVKGIEARAELAIDGTAMEPKVGVDKFVNRFLIRVAAAEELRFLYCTALA